jgi:transposase-like protein
MSLKQQQARDLYFNSGKTQKAIAIEIGVSERTIQYWVAQNQWQRLREASYHMPAMVADNYCRQLIELQNNIAMREPGNRFATNEEAETLRKLTNCMEKMKRYPTITMYKQVFETFRDFIRPSDLEFCRSFYNYQEKFMEAKAKNGFYPWEMEYTAQDVAPFDPSQSQDDVQDPDNSGPVPPQPSGTDDTNNAGVEKSPADTCPSEIIHKDISQAEPAISLQNGIQTIVNQQHNIISSVSPTDAITRKNPQNEQAPVYENQVVRTQKGIAEERARYERDMNSR